MAPRETQMSASKSPPAMRRSRSQGTGSRTRSMSRASSGRSRTRSMSRRRSTSRARRTTIRKPRRPRMISTKKESFHARIRLIKDKITLKHRIQDVVVSMINSFMNDIIRNVSIKAAENTLLPIYRNKTITYYDIMAASMEVFGSDNEWIKGILSKGEKKAELMN